MNFDRNIFNELSQSSINDDDKDTYWNLLKNEFLGSFSKIERLDYNPSTITQQRDYQLGPFSNNAWFAKTNITTQNKGSLFGKKIAIKDNISLANVPMELGTNLMKSFIPNSDATVVTRILNAGGTIAGKSVSENLFCAGSSFTADTGAIENPKVPGYSAGGSSSGSAALLASGQVDIALGCDQTGSIRIPSAWCGLYGFKASRGMIPYTGIVSVDQLLDSVGPMATNVKDLVSMINVISGFDELDNRTFGVKPNNYSFKNNLNLNITNKRIGILNEGFAIPSVSAEEVDTTVIESINQFKDLDAKIEHVSFPKMDLARQVTDVINAVSTYSQLIKNGGASVGTQNQYPSDISEAITSKINSTNISKLAPIVQAIYYTGLYADHQSINYYNRAQNISIQLKKEFSQLFDKVDVIALPTVPYTATKLPSENDDLTQIVHKSMGMDLNTGLFNLFGLPAISIPCNVGKNKPVGMMLVAKFGNDQELLNFAAAFEKMQY